MNTNTYPRATRIFTAAFVVSLLASLVSAQTSADVARRGKVVNQQTQEVMGPTSLATPIATATPLPSATPIDLSARPPRPADAIQSMKDAKLIFVRSYSLLVGQSVIETKLRNRKEFQQLGLMITRDEAAADLILEVKHDVFTKYVFTAIDPSTNVVVASGKLSSLGGTVAGKVAERFMKQMVKARTGP